MTARAFKAIVGPRGISISSTSYNSGTGILTINFSDASTYQTGDLRGTSGKGISNTSYNSGTGILTITFTDSSTYQTSDLRGATGATGKGISSTSYNASTGIVTITFTDSTTYQTGDLRGAAGAAGKGIVSTAYVSTTGILTITFTDSTTFQTTDLRGSAGAAGKGISSTSYNAGTGILTITFTDSTTYQTTDLRGSAGAAGKGISSTSYNAGTGILTVTYTDASTYQTGDLRGAAGATGKGITSTSYNATTGILTFTFSDSSTYQTGDLRAPNSSPLSYSFPLNETITANKIVQLLDSGKVEAIAGIPVTKNLNNWTESTFAAYATDITVKFDEEVGNRFVVTFLDNSTNYYNAIVGTVNGNTITFGSKYVILSTTGLTNVDFSFCKSQTNRIVFVYSAPTTGYLNAIVGTISGTALSFSSATLIKNTSCAYNKIEKDPFNNNVMLVHFFTGSYNYLKVISLASDVLTITGSNYSLPFTGYNFTTVKFSNITSGRFLIAVNCGSTINAVAGTISGTTITFGSAVTVDSVDAWYLSLSFAYNSDKFGIVYRENTNYYGCGKTGYLSGTVVMVNATQTIFCTLGSIGSLTMAADRKVADNYVCSVYGPGNSVLLFMFHDYGYLNGQIYSYQPFTGNKNGCTGIGICFNNASSSLIYIAGESNTTVFGRTISTVYTPYWQFIHQYYYSPVHSQIEFDPFNSNRFILAYISTYMYVVVGIINADGTISFSTACYSTYAQLTSCMVQFSPWESDKFIAAGSGSSGCYAFVGAITANVPSLGAANIITTNASDSLTFALDKLTPNSMAIAYYSQYYGYALGATIGSTTITLGTPGSVGSYVDICSIKSFFNPKLAGNWIFVVRNTVYVYSCLVNGLNVTVKNSVNLNSGYPANFDYDQNGDYFVLSWVNTDSPKLSKVVAITVGGNYTLIAGTPVQFESDSSGVNGYVGFDPAMGNRFFIMYLKTTTATLYIREGNISGQTITLNAAEAIPLAFAPGANSNKISFSALKAGYFLYQDSNGRILSGYINTTVSNINPSRIIGVLTESGVLNNVKNVSLLGGIYNGFSGLIIGATYYVTPAGDLTTTYAPKCFLLGKALSATCIQLKANI